MYEPPIELVVSQVQNEIIKSHDNQVYQAIVKTGVNVDKDELVKALAYDRDQYVKGYEDGMKDFAEELKAKCSLLSTIGFEDYVVTFGIIEKLLKERLGDTE